MESHVFQVLATATPLLDPLLYHTAVGTHPPRDQPHYTNTWKIGRQIGIKQTENETGNQFRQFMTLSLKTEMYLVYVLNNISIK